MDIEVRNIGKSYEARGREVTALRATDLKIRSNEFLTILGPSGCGKSTLLQILAGIEASTEGKIEFTGERHSSGPMTTMVWQKYALFPWRTVLENVAFGLEMRGVRKSKRLDQALLFVKAVGLEGFESAYPHELSGGMQQRVALARALCNDPEVLLMDEPLAALDAQTRALMQIELLRIWSQFNKTVVYITHSIDEAVLLGDRVAVMTKRPGKIKEIIEVTLPRPRTLDMLTWPEYHRLAGRAWQSIKEEFEEAQVFEEEVK
jgi:NitT/TauT family transport system ATP-binding protein